MGNLWHRFWWSDSYFELTWFDYVRIFGSLVPLTIQAATLVRVLRGSKHRFAIKILGILIGYNITNFGTEVMYRDINYNAYHGYLHQREFLISVGINCTGYILFNVSHWMFAFKYFSLSRQIPFKQAGKEVPRRIAICDKITDWVFFTLNWIAPVLLATGLVIILVVSSKNPDDWVNKTLKFFKMSNISYMVSISLPIISGILLFCALYNIYKSVKTQNETQVNLKAMSLHATSFGLYMVSVLIVVGSMTKLLL